MDKAVKRALRGLPLAEGAELAALLERLTQPEILAQLSDAERLDVVLGSARLDCWTASARARAVVALHDSALAREATGGDERHAAEARQLAERTLAVDLSLLLGVSFGTADRELDMALDLAEFPRLATALERGEVDVAQARVILAGLRGVAGRRDELLSAFLPEESPQDGEPTHPVARELARPGAVLWTLPPARLRSIVAREAARLDTDFRVAQAAQARAERRVDYEDHSDATATLFLRAGAEAVAAAYRNVDDAARTARRLGDPRTLDQLRADITVGWLTEGAFGTLVSRPGSQARSTDAQPRGPLVHVTVAATTMLGLDAEPATLHGPRGPVPIPAGLARELAHQRGARWRRLLYDPASGVATDLSMSYRPPPRMAEFVLARDGYQTRFPTSAATRLELDHVREWGRTGPSGGTTCPSNLAAVGKRDHQLKTDRVLTVTGDANSRLTYRTSAGRRYVSYPVAHCAVTSNDEGPAPPF